jgi:hypothetical protein
MELGKFFKSLAVGRKGFIGSFFEDYTILSDTNKKSIKSGFHLDEIRRTL